MTSNEIPETWLEEFNARMGEQEVPHVSRPFLALMEWTKIHRCTINGGSPTEKWVFDWFYARSPEGAHLVQDMYQGVFYLDAAFWPVRVPPMYGMNFSVDMSEFLLMPDAIKKRLLQNFDLSKQYKAVWADCFDYSYGIDDTGNEEEPILSRPFFAAADQQLSASATLLLQRPPQPKSMESCRMAVEMFLKAYLCIHHGFTEEEVRSSFRHDIERALSKVLSLSPSCALNRLNGRLGFFPAVGERYDGKSYSNEELWQAYRIALYTGATVVRGLSDRDMRGQLGIVF